MPVRDITLHIEDRCSEYGYLDFWFRRSTDLQRPERPSPSKRQFQWAAWGMTWSLSTAGGSADKARSTASGSLSMIRSKVRAAPDGCRVPCSHFLYPDALSFGI